MARQNYRHAKKLREESRKAKKNAKLERRTARVATTDPTAAPDPNAPEAASGVQAPQPSPAGVTDET